MMIPIPKRGIFKHVDGIDDARAVPRVDDVRITVKRDQLLVPLPEGKSYLGFIFARGTTGDVVVEALRRAHARLEFTIDKALLYTGCRVPYATPGVDSVSADGRQSPSYLAGAGT